MISESETTKTDTTTTLPRKHNKYYLTSQQYIIMSHGLSKDEVEDLKEAFNMFDVDGGGEWQGGGGDTSMGRILTAIFVSFAHLQP